MAENRISDAQDLLDDAGAKLSLAQLVISGTDHEYWKTEDMDGLALLVDESLDVVKKAKELLKTEDIKRAA